MKTYLLTALFAVATLAEVSTVPVVEATTTPSDDGVTQTFVDHPWGIVDFTSCILIGSYIPLLKMSYGNDKCFVYFFNWGASSIDYYSYFDHAFAWDDGEGWFKFLASLFLTGYDTYNMVHYCAKEYKNAKAFGEKPLFAEEWRSDDIRVMAGDEELHHEEKHDDHHGDDHHGHGYPDVLAIVMQCIYIGVYAFKIYWYYVSEYYFWSFGFAIGKTAFLVLQAVEIFGNVTILPNNRINYMDTLSF